MKLVSDNYHKKKLDEYNINIKTKYIVGNKILERNTDDSVNDDIDNGIRCEKDYYIGKNLVHTEKIFDSRIEYTFISKKLEEENYKCPNCGMESKIIDFDNGCPYCRTYYNIDYINSELGSKHHYDIVLKNPLYRIITGIVDLIISTILCYIFIITTSRTFNSYDISKIFIYGTILTLILYYFFYIIDAYIVLGPIKEYKNRQNQKQIEFWNKTKYDKKTFFNNLNYEVRKNYYSKSNIIDYDVLDFISFEDYKKKDNYYVKVIAEVRVMYYNSGKIKPKYFKDTYIMRKINKEPLKLEGGLNYIKCPTCGASIDVLDKKCKYCHNEINYLQEWIIDENEK